MRLIDAGADRTCRTASAASNGAAISLVLGETGAATPAARHLRTTRAPDEMERA